MKTVVLDLNGLASYPGFKSHFLEPVRAQGFATHFWTFEGQDNAKKILLDAQINDPIERVIDWDTSQDAIISPLF